ncbi:threonine aspartase 1-like [Plakobranchus ocellatus]|uniref:Threonine aspartase 1-like n=1 Tax=Plakobranchus ocellatus TaxID=259542 RepID=A0AAV4AVZ5_9GAST|nr:threonine aspartase 1-like [Plakobranchus ocellatus]
MALVKGQIYSSWDDFLAAMQHYMDTTYQPFVKQSSQLASKSNEKLKPGSAPFPEEEALKYCLYEFRCTHRGKYKGTGNGMKIVRSFKEGCPARVYASVDKAMKKIVVRSLVDEHNHPIGPHLYSQYPKQRLLSKEQESEILELCKHKLPTKVLRDHVREHYGKNVHLSDIRNLKFRGRKVENRKSQEHIEVPIAVDSPSLFIAVHAGAGIHSRDNESMYRAACKTACEQAMLILRERKSALEAVTAAVASLEDSECTNAGLGSNLTMDGTVECDASVMDGKSLYFGAVGALSGVKNPVTVAHKLAEEQKLGPLPFGRVRPSILVGDGARNFCKDCGIIVENNLVTKASFKTYNRYKRKCQQPETSGTWMKKLRPDLEHNGTDHTYLKSSGDVSIEKNLVQDTVGAVCVDHEGNVAAASSSGGIWLKHSGRIGPAAMYGAGCWAQNQVSKLKAGVAAVTSGCGEHLVQTLLAKTCCDSVRASSTDFSSSVASVFQNDFLGSEFLQRVGEKFGGALILKTKSHESGREVELSWIHSTASMCIALMDGSKKSPVGFMSRLEGNTSPGHSYTMGGHVTTCYEMDVMTDPATEENVVEVKDLLSGQSTDEQQVEETVYITI